MGLFSKWMKKRSSAAVCSAVIVAAGSSTRMGADKMMLTLGDMPVIARTIKAIHDVPDISEIIVVTREDLLVPVGQLCRDMALPKVKKVIRGGKSRTESVYLGAMETCREARVIAIHDGARPLVPAEVVRGAVARALETGAAAPAIPVKDTIKTAEKGIITGTPDRSALFAVQTPQVFEASLIRAALQKAMDEGVELTDDCAAVERMGMQVTLTEGSERNIKLTTATDLLMAECLLEGSVVL